MTDSNPMCTICLENPGDLFQPACCQAMFCTYCAREWVRKSRLCAHCRTLLVVHNAAIGATPRHVPDELCAHVAQPRHQPRWAQTQCAECGASILYAMQDRHIVCAVCGSAVAARLAQPPRRNVTILTHYTAPSLSRDRASTSQRDRDFPLQRDRDFPSQRDRAFTSQQDPSRDFPSQRDQASRAARFPVPPRPMRARDKFAAAVGVVIFVYGMGMFVYGVCASVAFHMM